MPSLIESIVADGTDTKNPTFPDAPEGWATATALRLAEQEGLTLGEAHWEVLRALQSYLARHQELPINLRELHDALDEKFHAQGGIRFLYQIFPGGPVAQGCRFAGLQPPAGVIDRGFGSVV